MAGVFDSGFEVVMEVGFEQFRRLALGELRRSLALGCGDFTTWFEDLDRDGQGNFRDWQFPPFNAPFQTLNAEQARTFFRGVLPLDAAPFVRSLSPGLGETDLHIRPGIDPDPVIIGYDVALAQTPAPGDLAGFRRDIRTDASGRAHDWAIVISDEAMDQILFQVEAALRTSGLFQTGVGVIRLEVTETLANWDNPLTLNGHARVTFNDREIDIDFTSEGRLFIDAQAMLGLELVIQNDASSFWDRQLHYGSDRRNASNEALRAAILGAFHAQFDRFIPIPGRDFVLCQAVMPTGHGSLGADVVEQTADFLRLLGSVSASVPGRPHLTVIDDSTGQALNFGNAQFPDLGPAVLFEEDPRSLCGGNALGTLRKTLTLRNDGTGPLFICGIWGPDLRNGFHAFVFRTLPFTLGPDETWQITVEYDGDRQAARALLRIVCNQPPDGQPLGPEVFYRFITLKMLAGHTSYRVDPPEVDMRVANTKTGTPRVQLGPHCHPTEVRVPAGSFRILNTGSNPLYLCRVNQDPSGVFAVPFVPTRVEPGDYQEYGVLFFPAQVMTPYSFDLVSGSSEGDIHIPLHGQVDALPRVGDQGDWVDLVTNTLCVPPNIVCKLLNVFGGVDPPGIPIMSLTIDGAPPDAQVAIGGGDGATLVTDYSGDSSRAHDLAFSATPDGAPAPDDPCNVLVRGPGPDPPPDWTRVDVTGNVILPIGEWEAGGELGPVLAKDGWVYAGSGHAILAIDWNNPREPTVVSRVGLGAMPAIAIDGNTLVAATGDELVAFDISRPGKPAEVAKAQLGKPVTGLAVNQGWLLAATGDAVAALKLESGRLVAKGRAEMPQSATWVGAVGANFYAASDRRIGLFRLNAAGEARVLGARALDKRIAHIAPYGSDLLVSGSFGTTLLRIDRSAEIRPAADYRKPHWSLAYLPDPGTKRFVQVASGRVLRLWSVAPRKIDRAKFPALLELQYRPRRP